MGGVYKQLGVQEPQVVNNLNTTEEGYVLDARQGKVLNDKIEKQQAYYGTYVKTVGYDNISSIIVEAADSNMFYGIIEITNSYAGVYKDIFGILGPNIDVFVNGGNSGKITYEKTETSIKFTMPGSTSHGMITLGGYLSGGSVTFS